MSKLDAQRAMREANYERARAQAPVRPAASGAAGEACGHRSMNGRTCTREAGHSEKSHRYG